MPPAPGKADRAYELATKALKTFPNDPALMKIWCYFGAARRYSRAGICSTQAPPRLTPMPSCFISRHGSISS